MANLMQLAKTQYNGMILLSSYIERLYVQASISKQLGDHHDEQRAPQFKQYYEDLSMIMAVFEESKMLTEHQLNKMLDIYEEVNAQFQSFFKVGEPTLSEKVALIAASFYGERHLNEKIIRLSQLFDAKISTDYERRIGFYNDRIKLMDYVVIALTKGDPLKPELLEQLDTWYGNITSIQEHVVTDLTKVPQLLLAN